MVKSKLDYYSAIDNVFNFYVIRPYLYRYNYEQLSLLFTS